MDSASMFESLKLSVQQATLPLTSNPSNGKLFLRGSASPTLDKKKLRTTIRKKTIATITGFLILSIGFVLLNMIIGFADFLPNDFWRSVVRGSYDIIPSYEIADGGYVLKEQPINEKLPMDFKVSVVIMNHHRPRMIRGSSLMRTLVSHGNVDEIFILHSNPATAFNLLHPKIINYDAIQENKEMGLSLRFHFCQFTKNDAVLFIDDDMEFTRNTLDELFIEYVKNPKRIVGLYGRDMSSNEEDLKLANGYKCKDAKKETEVVLTKVMVMERDVCSAFFQYEPLVADLVKEAPGPKWNGEDIFMSLVANHVYGKDGMKNNFAMPWLDVWEGPDSLKDYSYGKLDISGVGVRGNRWWDIEWRKNRAKVQNHRAFRGTFWQTARKRLIASGPFSTSQQQQQQQITTSEDNSNNNNMLSLSTAKQQQQQPILRRE